MQIRDALRLTASNAASPNNQYGWGIVNAVAALNYLSATDVAEQALPHFERMSVSPNPFNPVTTILYRLDEPAFVSVRIFDPRGRLVRTLFQGDATANAHSWIWNGRDDEERPVSSGVYVCRLRATRSDHRVAAEERKLVLLR